MPKRKRGRSIKDWQSNRAAAGQGKLRIVGGKYRGRQIAYTGDPVTRPMKDHTREALFNLVGGWVEGKVCFDLFAGTGAVGIEAMSRGASRAYLIERHIPTLQVVRENVRSIDEGMDIEIVGSDSFFWAREFFSTPDQWPTPPWIVFCCPPYAVYLEKTSQIAELLQSFIDAAPEHSLIVVEAGEDFDCNHLPQPEKWEVRHYSPAQVAVFKKWD